MAIRTEDWDSSLNVTTGMRDYFTDLLEGPLSLDWSPPGRFMHNFGSAIRP